MRGQTVAAVNNPDSAILIKDEAGNLKLSNRYFNADGTKAPQIRLERVLDDGTVYVSECIPDSVNKRIYITSAYAKKKTAHFSKVRCTSPEPNVQ